MSRATGTRKTIEIYVQLLNEGTVVFRPAPATPVGPNVVKILQPDDYDPEDEEWEFKPGATVRVRSRILSGDEELVAVAEVKEPRG